MLTLQRVKELIDRDLGLKPSLRVTESTVERIKVGDTVAPYTWNQLYSTPHVEYFVYRNDTMVDTGACRIDWLEEIA